MKQSTVILDSPLTSKTSPNNLTPVKKTYSGLGNKHTIAAKVNVDHVIYLLSQIYPLSENLAKEFKENAVELTISAGNHLLLQGDVCKYMYFIKSGAVMGYLKQGGNCITTYISIENEFVSSLSGLHGQLPSKEGIVAIEDSVLLGVDTDLLLGWYEKYFDLNYIIRKVYEEYYRDAQERSFVIRAGDAKERYKYFVESKLGDVNRLPVNHVASFLNMKPATLINVKKEILNEKITNSDSLALAKILEDYIIGSQGFKNKIISIKTLSESFNVAPAKISFVFKHHLKTNCKDYINIHRIIYFKNLLKERNKTKNLTLTALALEAGFASKSSFYLAFKKTEGQSPKTFLS